MALTYDYTRCPITKEEVAAHNTTVESAIFSTMVIDIGDWTPQRINEVEARLRLYAKLSEINYDDVIKLLPKLIGLRTNVFYVPEKKWLKRITEHHMLNCHFEVKQYAKSVRNYIPEESNG